MPTHIMRCQKCQSYTISDKCPKCGGPLENVFPPKFSPQDKYQQYRLDYFKEKMKKKFEDILK
jgi:H/ACA ribonucleoprotein complex subunit 3